MKNSFLFGHHWWLCIKYGALSYQRQACLVPTGYCLVCCRATMFLTCLHCPILPFIWYLFLFFFILQKIKNQNHKMRITPTTYGTISLSKFLLSLWWLRLHALSASGCSKSNFTCFFLFPFIYLFLIFLNCYINELLILSETPSICLHSHVLLCWSWLNITFHNACLIMNLASLLRFTLIRN